MAHAGTSASAVSAAELEAAAAKFLEAKSLKKTDIDKALQLLAEVLEVQANHYGPDAPECADAYFHYGLYLFDRSLACEDALQSVPEVEKEAGQLESTRENIDPNAPAGHQSRPRTFGGPQRPLAPLGAEPAAEGDDEGDDEEDGEEEEEGEEAAGEGGAEAAGDGGAGGTTAADKGKAVAGSDEPDEEGGQDEDEDEEMEGGEPGADGDDMALAWHVLEMARVVYKANPEQNRKRLAEIHLTLGDILSEQEKFEEASGEYRCALEQLSFIEPPPLRRQAETHFQLCMAQAFLDELPEALKSCDTALELLRARQTELEALADELAEQPDRASELADCALELKELEPVVGDVEVKGEELRALLQQRASMKNPLKEAMALMVQALATTDPATGAAGLRSTTAGDAGPKQVQDLGVAGRGKRRITAVPINASPPQATTIATATTQPGPEHVPPKKRTLQDLMGGGAEGETVIGFGKAATNSSEGDPFKKTRAEP